MARLSFSPSVVLVVCVTDMNFVGKGWYGHKTLEMGTGGPGAECYGRVSDESFVTQEWVCCS